MTELLDAALSYAALGWRVLPVHGVREDGSCTCFAGARCTQPGKHPLWPRWTEMATADEATLRAAWGEGVDYNVGIATGAASGFWCLDVDPRHGGGVTLRSLLDKAREEKLPPTVAEKTGGGGWHFLFRHINGLGNRVNALGQGLDIRADGGQIVVAPSRHASGRRYEWAEGRAPSVAAIRDAPDWLVAALVEERSTATLGREDEYWRDLFEKGVEAGGRNDAIARMAGHLLRRRVHPSLALEVCQLWNVARCRPPLGADEVWTTVNSIAGREADRVEKRRARDG